MCKWSASITMAGLALGSLLLSGSPAGAQAVYAPHIDQREAYQEQSIQQGINNGSLTRGEARYLENEQARIQATEDRMRADGNLSPRERERLNQMQNQASRDINRLENNNRTTAGYSGNQAGWRGNNPGGSVPVTSGTPTASNTQGWRNGSGSGTAANGTTTAGNATGTTQGWQGTGRGPASAGNANYRNGQPGSNQQAGAQAGQGRQQYQRPPLQGTQPQMRTNQAQQYQQARSQMPQTQMRPNVNMMARQPAGMGGMVNRASFSVPRAAPRRR